MAPNRQAVRWAIVVLASGALLVWQPQTPMAFALCTSNFKTRSFTNKCKRRKLCLGLTPPHYNSQHATEEETTKDLTTTPPKQGDYTEIMKSNQERLIGMSVLLLLLTISISQTALPALAIDHPVDFSHLNIPNPIPDADPRYFVSGGICAAASHGVTTPLDVVKTRIQSEPEVFNKGIVDAATSIVRDDGPQELLNGLLPTIVGYGVEGALKFGLYESLKPTFVQLLLLDDPTEGYLAASVAAGAVASIVLCPMEQTRIRLVTDPDFADGFFGGISRLIQEEGVESIFYGFLAMLSKQVPYTMAKQVSFDMFAGFFYALALQRVEVEFLAAFFASILACIASHPGDVILTATYKNAGAGNSFGSVVATLNEQQGVKAFFTGITARFFHVGAIITSQLILYDIIKQLLGLPATGTH